MNFGGIGGYPATISSGFSKAIPVAGKGVAPAGYGKGLGGFGKGVAPAGFGKGLGGFGKGLGGFGKGLGGFGKGYPATKASGFSSVVPTTKVATSPYPGVI